MKSTKQDTFLIGHARRIRKCRQRQQESDPEAYRNRVRKQKIDYRLRTSFNVLSENQALQKNESLIKNRNKTLERVRRFRHNQSDQQKELLLAKDRNYKCFKREKQRIDDSNKQMKNETNVTSNSLHPIPNCHVINKTTYIFFE
ncbi:unnamed protein product [Rotaria magnacalcarata]|uniref:Uncharacterized protein n=1 Tax=Rotaria magnacalcarata TaxID=392030 RepID=A0A820DT96_9BILA|nr:unnamed protein product [Rotaria magnacalcarata]CAF4236198.1 unnamed protein product [Rotaria magnacalcarata]